MLKKRSVLVSKHPTSVSLEDAFWQALESIAKRNKQSLNTLVSNIDRTRDTVKSPNLSSAIRVYVLKTLQTELQALESKNENN